MQYFLTILIKVIVLIAMALPGFILRKTKLMPDGASKGICNILIYIAIPFLAIKGFLDVTYTTDILAGIGYSALLAVLMHLAALFLAKIAFRKGTDPNKIAQFSTIFSNCGFFGYPVIGLLFPNLPEAMIYAVIFNAVFNFLSYTLGIYIMTGDRKKVSIVGAIISPVTIALIIGLPLFFFKVPVKESAPTVSLAIDYLGNLATPLAMIVMGIKLADSNAKKLFKNGNMYIVTFLRLVVSPFVTCAIAMLLQLFLPISGVVIASIVVLAGMPVATVTIAMADSYDKDGEEAAIQVIGSTIFSIASIPVMALLLQYIMT